MLMTLFFLEHSEIEKLKLTFLEKYTIANKLTVNNLNKTIIIQFSRGGFKKPNFDF